MSDPNGDNQDRTGQIVPDRAGNSNMQDVTPETDVTGPTGNKLPVSLIEELVFHPYEGMEDWRYFRISYGGVNEATITEGGIWLPPWADPVDIREYLMRTQRVHR